MNSFIDWLEGYLEDKLDDEFYLKRIREKYQEIEDKKFTDNVILPNLEEWKNGGNMSEVLPNHPVENFSYTDANYKLYYK